MRIINLPSGTQTDDDYIGIDNSTDGTRKIKVGDLYASLPSPTYANGILAYAENVAPLGMTIVSPRNMGSSDLPDSGYIYAAGIILKRSSANISVTLIPDASVNLPIVMNSHSSTVPWQGWKTQGSAYITSKTNFYTYLLQSSETSALQFRMSAASCNAIFELGSYNAVGFLTPLSATTCQGVVTINEKLYVFTCNPTTQTVTTLTRITEESETPIKKDFGTLTSSSPVTINLTGTIRCVLVLISSSDARAGMYVVNASTSNAYVFPVGTAPSSITVDTATAGKIKFTSTSTANTYIFGIFLAGANNASV